MIGVSMIAATIAAPTLAADSGGDYVVAAYAVFVALLLVYIGIMAVKLVRLQRGLGDLIEHVRKADDDA